nr:TonB-dependent receptor plug domain-containing protein [Sphingomonas sp. Leaf21]
MKKQIVAAALGATALTAMMPMGAVAQSAQTARTTERFDIPAGPLVEALQAWSRITRRQIIYRMEDVGGKRTDGLRGNYDPTLALQGLLLGTGLKLVTTEDGAVALRPLAGDEIKDSATPDILVKGRRNWTLNTGIERTQNDSQPFIVMDRKEIERSGAPNLEAFLRNQLNVNTSPIAGDQPKAGGTSAGTRVGLSNINLRGIGSRDTLILIDGRRQPGINLGDGDISQPSITGIPIAAVERIEVLASSASGIYGSGASGGVINIVLRRDFKGGELSLNYDNTSDFKQGRGTIDLVAGVPLEHGRTRVSLTANWTKSEPLLYSDRENLRQRGLKALLANNPDSFYGAYAYPPQGTTPNFMSYNGQPLQLKPAYGGQTLTSMYGTIPQGYAGVQTAGITPLLAGIGKYNLDQPNTASGFGKRTPLIFPVDQYSGSLAVRREFNTWLTAYAEVGLQHSTAFSTSANVLQTFVLSATAANNPFTQDVLVTLPGDPRYDVTVKSTASTFRTLGGAIFKLPYDWQAVTEVAYSKSRSTVGDSAPGVAYEASSLLGAGTLNGFRDTLAYPVAIPYDSTPYYTRQGGGDSSNLAPSLRLAGPLPVTLPGGQVWMTINAELNDQQVKGLRTTVLSPLFPYTQYIPDGRQTTKSIYAEAVFPLVGEKQELRPGNRYGLPTRKWLRKYSRGLPSPGTAYAPRVHARAIPPQGVPLSRHPSLP